MPKNDELPLYLTQECPAEVLNIIHLIFAFAKAEWHSYTDHIIVVCDAVTCAFSTNTQEDRAIGVLEVVQIFVEPLLELTTVLQHNDEGETEIELRPLHQFQFLMSPSQFLQAQRKCSTHNDVK